MEIFCFPEEGPQLSNGFSIFFEEKLFINLNAAMASGNISHCTRKNIKNLGCIKLCYSYWSFVFGDLIKICSFISKEFIVFWLWFRITL